MGEYWKLFNVTKNQCLHPHRLDNGLKFGEWADYDSNVIRRARGLIKAGHWSAADELRAVSDYGGSLKLLDIDTLHYGHNSNDGGDMYKAGVDVSTDPKLPGETKLRDWGAPPPPKLTEQDVDDIATVARRVQRDCPDPGDLAAASRLLERIGQ